MPRGLDAFIESNQKFHLEIAHMTHNVEFEALLRGVLERSTRLVYLAAQGAKEVPKEIESLLKPIVDAIRKRDAVGAHEDAQLLVCPLRGFVGASEVVAAARSCG